MDCDKIFYFVTVLLCLIKMLFYFLHSHFTFIVLVLMLVAPVVSIASVFLLRRYIKVQVSNVDKTYHFGKQNEEAYIAAYYAGDAMTMMDENENLAAYVPREGANMFFDSMCVLKSSRNKEAAEKFINFMCETEIAVRTGPSSP